MAHSLVMCDNSFGAEPLPADVLQALSPLAGISLKELQKESRLLIYPHSLGVHRDGIEQQSIFELNGGRLQTGNVLGYIGIDGVQLFIHSRFDQSSTQYLLHYLLQRVMGITILDLPVGTAPAWQWDLLVYMFPHCLQRALAQGLFRAYQRRDYNDSALRGTMDVARHVQRNQPFAGRVAYSTRERTADNALMQLVRHTVEYIARSAMYSRLLGDSESMRAAVATVRQATPAYCRQDRSRVIATNLRPVRHPYFTEYAALQTLCLQILQHEKISYGQDERSAHGMVFDGAWLWEEYLATILRDCGYRHPENKTGRGRLYLYRDQRGLIYPDFFKDDVVIDAKYKRMDKNGISREDRFQMIAYLHVTKAGHGYFAFPTQAGDARAAREGTLNGYGGDVGTLPFIVPSMPSDFAQFSAAMATSEHVFADNCRALGAVAAMAAQ
ncbi:MAG: 3-isopropylmalate dehydrogenase [Lentisphaerae bacterium]|nr:3-isopropylmalate dehydrogenase [Lentisphaerota bacterium]